MLIYAMASGYQEYKSAVYLNAFLVAKRQEQTAQLLRRCCRQLPALRQNPHLRCKRLIHCANVLKSIVIQLLWQLRWSRSMLPCHPQSSTRKTAECRSAVLAICRRGHCRLRVSLIGCCGGFCCCRCRNHSDRNGGHRGNPFAA